MKKHMERLDLAREWAQGHNRAAFPDNRIREFCERFRPCREGRDWALENCTDMADAWDKLEPTWLIWVATREGVIDDRTLRLFACRSVRQVWHLLTDARSRSAVETAERYAVGEATLGELTAARAAEVVAWAAEDAAWAADWEACAADWEACAAATCGAAGAAKAAAWAAQARQLRSMVANPFRPGVLA